MLYMYLCQVFHTDWYEVFSMHTKYEFEAYRGGSCHANFQIDCTSFLR